MIKINKTPLLMALMGLSVAMPAKAELFDDMYISAATGITITSDADFKDSSDTGHIEIDNSVNLSLALGKSINENIRAEIEVSHRNADLENLTVDGLGSAAIDGDFKTTAVLLNSYYDFNPNDKFSPYVSAGIGFARHDGELTGGAITTSADDTVFAYQIGAGASYDIADAASIFGGYRYLGSSEADLDGLDAEYDAHELRVGVRYGF